MPRRYCTAIGGAAALKKDVMQIHNDFEPCWKTAKGQNPLSAMPKVINRFEAARPIAETLKPNRRRAANRYFSIDTVTGQNSMRIKNYRETFNHADTR